MISNGNPYKPIDARTNNHIWTHAKPKAGLAKSNEIHEKPMEIDTNAIRKEMKTTMPSI